MKNILTKSMIALSFVAILISCKKKEITPADVPTYAAPVITFANGTTSHQFTLTESSYKISGNTTSENKLKEVSFSVISNKGEKALGSAITTFSNTSSYDFQTVVDSASLATAGVVLDSVDQVNGIIIKVIVTDLKALVTTGNFTLTFTPEPSQPSGGDINTYTATLLGDQGNSNVGSYYATSTNSVYIYANAASNSSMIDMVYYYGSNNLATLAAPNDPTINGGSGNLSLGTILNPQNTTIFRTTKLTASDFDAITNDATFSSFTGADLTKVPTLNVGDVIAFKTVAGKVGVIKVTKLVAGTSGVTNGSITITVKVQK